MRPSIVGQFNCFCVLALRFASTGSKKGHPVNLTWLGLAWTSPRRGDFRSSIESSTIQLDLPITRWAWQSLVDFFSWTLVITGPSPSPTKSTVITRRHGMPALQPPWLIYFEGDSESNVNTGNQTNTIPNNDTIDGVGLSLGDWLPTYRVWYYKCCFLYSSITPKKKSSSLLELGTWK